MEEEKKARTTAKAQFTRAEGSLRKAVSSEADEWTMLRRYEELKDRWNKVQDAHDTYILTLDDAAAVAEGDWIDELIERFSNAELAVGKCIESSKKRTEQDTKESGNVQKIHTPETLPLLTRGIKMETLKFETFKGNIRKYPDFKSEFTKYIQPQCHPTQLAFILKSYLNEDVKEEVINVGDDYDEMWRRLDMKYGNVGKLVDSILSDVKRLSSSSNRPEDTLKMINTVEKAWRDLKALGQATELYNSTTISIIEQAMSEQMKLEWVKMIASKTFDSYTKFSTLLDLLRDWRNRIEYLAADIREEDNRSTQQVAAVHQVNSTVRTNRESPSRRTKCWFHSIEGGPTDHNVWQCRLFRSKTVSERKNLVTVNNACPRCLSITCPGGSDINNCSLNFTCRVGNCGGMHHRLLHEDAGEVHHNLESTSQQNSSTLLPIQELDAL